MKFDHEAHTLRVLSHFEIFGVDTLILDAVLKIQKEWEGRYRKNCTNGDNLIIFRWRLQLAPSTPGRTDNRPSVNKRLRHSES
jgi:hypothetical protein